MARRKKNAEETTVTADPTLPLDTDGTEGATEKKPRKPRTVKPKTFFVIREATDVEGNLFHSVLATFPSKAEALEFLQGDGAPCESNLYLAASPAQAIVKRVTTSVVLEGI